VVYFGSQESRKVIRETEFYFAPKKLKAFEMKDAEKKKDKKKKKGKGKGKEDKHKKEKRYKKDKQKQQNKKEMEKPPKRYKFNVLITSYELIRLDSKDFLLAIIHPFQLIFYSQTTFSDLSTATSVGSARCG